MLETLDRRALEEALDRSLTVVHTFRLISKSGPTYVSMKISRMEDDDRYIIIGITDIDEHMKQRRATQKLREEQLAYSRLSALAGNFLSIYVVDPRTEHYREIRVDAEVEDLVRTREGDNFFTDGRDASLAIVYPEDRSRYLSLWTRENVMTEIERCGSYTLSYRVVLDGQARYVQIKAVMVEEEARAKLIVGINDIDAQVRQEETYVQSLAQAQIEAHVDPLTGVRNRHAYMEAEERLNIQIAEGHVTEFAIVLLDVNDLKQVNDVQGHQAGDQFLRDACKIICDTFKHSPVYRVGGDEFTVVAQGSDYECIDELIAQMDSQNAEALRSGGIVIACGMAKREKEISVAPVFVRADQLMYENKSDLKDRREDK